MEIGATHLGGDQQTAPGDIAIGLSRKGILDGPRPGSPLRRAIEQQTDQAVFSPESLVAAGEAVPEAEEAQDQEALIRDPATDDLSEEEQREVDELEQRDQEVRRHEQAHKAAAGSYARGAANLEYTAGPDGKRYASGGNVKIDVSPERTPEATIRKMKVIQRAALAPAEPSAQDRGVYRTAVRQEQAARQEIVEERQATAQSAQEPGAEQPFRAQSLNPRTPLQPDSPGTAQPDASQPPPLRPDGSQQSGLTRPVAPEGASPLAPTEDSPLRPEASMRPSSVIRSVNPFAPGSGPGQSQPGPSAEQSPLAPPRRPLVGPTTPPTATLDERV